MPRLSSQRLFIKWLLKSEFPQKFVNLSFIITGMKNTLTDLCENHFLQDNFINTFCEINSDAKAKLTRSGRLRVPASSSSSAPSQVLEGPKWNDARVYEPQTRARLGTTAHFCKVFVLQLRAVGHMEPLYMRRSIGRYGARQRSEFRVSG